MHRPSLSRGACLALALTCTLGLASAAQAQAPISLRYTRGKDTLRFSRVDSLVISGGLAVLGSGIVAGDARSDTAGSLAASANVSQSDMLQISSSAVVALAFEGKDGATAWIDSLDIATDNGPGKGTADAIGKPFVLKFDDKGLSKIDKVPSFQSRDLLLAHVSNFADALLPRFPDQPQARMHEWVDTTEYSYSANGQQVKVTAAGRYRIIRDTVVDGTQAIVISGHVQLTRQGTGEVAGRMVVAKLSGDCDERTYFAPSLGTVVLRTRRWQFEGRGPTGIPGRGMEFSVVSLIK